MERVRHLLEESASLAETVGVLRARLAHAKARLALSEQQIVGSYPLHAALRAHCSPTFISELLALMPPAAKDETDPSGETALAIALAEDAGDAVTYVSTRRLCVCICVSSLSVS